MGKAIYQPAGKAREYALWACNLHVGCSNDCDYCYCKRGALGTVWKPQGTLKSCFKDENDAFLTFQKELMRSDEEAEERIADYRKLLSLMHMTQEYLEQIMYYSRLEVSSKDYHLSAVSVNSLIRQVAVKNRENVSDKGSSLEVSPLSSDCNVTTDDKWMIFILGQIISNSLKYKKEEDSVISLKAVRDSDDLVEIKVRDNGIGIPAGDIDMVFEKSFTGENGRHYSESTGMGLYIVKTLCDRLGHEVTISSVQGEWTEVTIRIGINDYLETAVK